MSFKMSPALLAPPANSVRGGGRRAPPLPLPLPLEDGGGAAKGRPGAEGGADVPVEGRDRVTMAWAPRWAGGAAASRAIARGTILILVGFIDMNSLSLSVSSFRVLAPSSMQLFAQNCVPRIRLSLCLSIAVDFETMCRYTFHPGEQSLKKYPGRASLRSKMRPSAVRFSR